MNISVFGIGYVGAVSAACLAESGHTVIAVDIDENKVEALNSGKAVFTEPRLEALIGKNVQENRLYSTTDPHEAVLSSECSFICVGTPSDADGALDLQYVQSACTDIGRALKEKDEDHIIVMRSTVLPGTLDDHIAPWIEEASGKTCGTGFYVANNPEFLREGCAIDDYNAPTMIVIGTHEQKIGQRVMGLYQHIDAPKTICAPATAEGLKYVSNAWRANKVSFANEMGNVLKAHGVDSHAVMDLFFQDTTINLGKSFLTPGFAFGGSCLPKDVRALKHSANDKGLPTPLFNSVLEANETQIERAFSMIQAQKRQKVGLIGLSFKAGTDDVRESPLLALAEKIIDAGMDLKISDPLVAGPSIRRTEIANALVDSGDSLAAWSEVIVVGHKTQDAEDIIAEADAQTVILDLVGIDRDKFTSANYAGICW